MQSAKIYEMKYTEESAATGKQAAPLQTLVKSAGLPVTFPK